MMSEMLHFIFLGEVFRGLSIYSFRDNIDVEKKSTLKPQVKMTYI